MNIQIKYIFLLIISLILNSIAIEASSISYTEGITFDVKISVMIYNSTIKSYELTSASIKISGNSPYSLADSLLADNNIITIKDGSDKYIVEISKTGYELYREEFSNDSIKLFNIKPLIVVLNPQNSKNKPEKKIIKEPKKDKPVSKSKPLPKNLENQLIAYYPFDGNPNDSSINHNNGQDYGPAGYTEGKYSEARYFSNNQDRDAVAIDFTILPNVIGSDDFSIDFWAKFDYSETHQFIFYLSPNQDWTSANFGLHLSADMKLSAIINGLDLRTIDYTHNQLLSGNFSNAFAKSPALELNRFYNICCVFKDKTFTIYIDGKVYAAYSNVYKNVGKPDAMLLVGACPQPGKLYYPYTGQIDDLLFFKRALTEKEINLLSKQ